MHKGIQEFLSWIYNNPHIPGLSLNTGATTSDFARIEQWIGSPLPADLRLVLSYYNGGILPSGQLLSVGGDQEGSIESLLRKLAAQSSQRFIEPDLLLPFYRTDENSILAFDRSAAPVADTWPIIDYNEESQQVNLVFRTFDGFCRFCIADWTSDDFNKPFSLKKYLNIGARHVAIEPDVSIAHATYAHGLRRAGNPEQALQSYLRAGRCVPAQLWCDWEALKIAVLIGDISSAINAAVRLCSWAPERRWQERETTPEKVADVIGQIGNIMDNRDIILRLLDQLSNQATTEKNKQRIISIREALVTGSPLPLTHPLRKTQVPPLENKLQWWEELKQAYRDGKVKEEDLLLDPEYLNLRKEYSFIEILKIKRDF